MTSEELTNERQTAGEQLRLSVDAHMRYRLAAHDRKPIGAALSEALARRVDALTLDPERLDPVWAEFETRYPHEALMTFYAEQLAR